MFQFGHLFYLLFFPCVSLFFLKNLQYKKRSFEDVHHNCVLCEYLISLIFRCLEFTSRCLFQPRLVRFTTYLVPNSNQHFCNMDHISYQFKFMLLTKTKTKKTKKLTCVLWPLQQFEYFRQQFSLKHIPTDEHLQICISGTSHSHANF